MKRILRLAAATALAALPAVALAALPAVAFTAPPAVAFASSSSRQVRATNCDKELYKPATIILTCGDANTYLTKMKWSSWSTAKAAGSGTYTYNLCTPDCAAGQFKSYPVTAALSEPKRCSRQTHKVFNILVVTFPHGRPSYVRSGTDRFALGCPF